MLSKEEIAVIESCCVDFDYEVVRARIRGRHFFDCETADDPFVAGSFAWEGRRGGGATDG